MTATRLSTKGLGASQPLADNDSSIGRAQNRRVELVKN
jgi:outer membrane protein OmpA-like peptidoglycan-associated protein